jgi:2-dehydro-3-deoxyphosphooctonate aldolase (KDO 8-P synthase)
MNQVFVGDVPIGNGAPLVFIGGPDAIEGESFLVEHAAALRDITRKVGIPFIFKSSYDKANRLSLKSYRGPGIKEGLPSLLRIRRDLKLPVLVDVHTPEEAEFAGPQVDALQIPAFLCRQTDLAVACARFGRAVNIKKGQFMAPHDMQHLIEKIRQSGNPRVLVSERGTTFGYNNLVVDMRSLAVMRSFGVPVVFDAGHSVQLPGAAGGASGGQREMIPVLARAAVAAGCDALFMEVHRNPDQAPCDGPNMWPIDRLEKLLCCVARICKAVSAK